MKKDARAIDPIAPLPVAARRHRVIAELQRGLATRCGVSAGVRIVLGVSGGADSMALLLGCAVLRERANDGEGGLTPLAVHVHHHLRGRSADDDAGFVTEICERLSVECRIEHVRPANLPGNTAENARVLRYRALAGAARSIGSEHVAVAHHADDQFETMLIALCRGSGAGGLGGMPWRRPLDGGVELIRPLLAVRRRECADLCRAAGIEWREDAGNEDPTSLRGRLRRDVLPVLEELWPDAPGRTTAAADSLHAAQAALAGCIEAAFGPAKQRCWRRDDLRDLPLPVLAAGLRRAALDEGPELSDDVGQRLLLPAAELIAGSDRRPKRFDWPGGLRLEIDVREVRLRRGED